MDKRNIHAITNIFSTTENTKIAKSFKGLSTSFLFQKSYLSMSKVLFQFRKSPPKSLHLHSSQAWSYLYKAWKHWEFGNKVWESPTHLTVQNGF